MNTIRNLSAYPDEDVRRIVRFAGKDVDTAYTMVHVEPMIGRGNWNGVAYPDVWHPWLPMKFRPVPVNTEFLVVIRIAPPEILTLPDSGRYRKRAQPYCLHTWQECVVYVAAHEFKHIEQFREGLDTCEVRCEAFAAHMLKQFRLTDEGRPAMMHQGNQGVAA